jgi:hypothetical protein
MIDLAEELRSWVELPPRRYRAMRVLLARQAAFRVAGHRHRAYFRKYRPRLIREADKLIRRYARFAGD